MNLIKDGKRKTKVKVKESLREQGLKIQGRKKMWHLKRSSMQQDKDMDHNSSIEVMILDSWSVGHVTRNTLGDIFHRISMVGLRYTVHRRHKLLGMWDRLFLIFMQSCTIDR